MKIKNRGAGRCFHAACELNAKGGRVRRPFLNLSRGHRAAGFFFAVCLVGLSLALFAANGRAAGQDVLTWHNNNARTGEDLSETVLTPANVKPQHSESSL